MTAYKYFLVYFIGVGLLLTAMEMRAQAELPLPQVIAKISLINFINPFQPSAHVAIEHRLQQRWYLHHQVGYLFEYIKTQNVKNHNGFRLRSGVRHYFNQANNLNFKKYLELNISYLESKMNLEGDFCRFDCAYFQRLAYTRQQEVYTVALEWGQVNYLSAHWLMEIGVSGGAQFGDIRFSEIPTDAMLSEPTFSFSAYNPAARVTPVHFGLRLKLGYVLK